jgi:hypothetical protein
MVKTFNNWSLIYTPSWENGELFHPLVLAIFNIIDKGGNSVTNIAALLAYISIQRPETKMFAKEP